MATAEELAVQQLNEERAQEDQDQAQTKAPSSESDRKISNVEFGLIGIIAAAKDALDLIDTASVLLIVLSILANIVATFILWLWCLLRLHKFPLKRFLGSDIAEFIPFLNALPFWTAFIVSIWIEQNHPKIFNKLQKLVSLKNVVKLAAKFAK